MGEDITIEIGGDYGLTLSEADQSIKYVDMSKWPSQNDGIIEE